MTYYDVIIDVQADGEATVLKDRTGALKGRNILVSVERPVQSKIAYAHTGHRSSMIRAIGYNPATQELDVQFLPNSVAGVREYRYSDVPFAIAVRFFAADSKGSFYNTWIKGKYLARKIAG